MLAGYPFKLLRGRDEGGAQRGPVVPRHAHCLTDKARHPLQESNQEDIAV